MAELLHSRYRLIDELGRGAMGVVWRAEDTLLQRNVAIKELRLASGVDVEEARDRFLVEARAAARVSHPNLVAIHDVFTDGPRVLISMELVVGPTLQHVLRTSGAQPPSVVRAIMAQVAQALAAAHSNGVIHRDLKPENVFWTPDGRAVVADFGLARIGAGRGTLDGTLLGTPGYMAPEQVRGHPLGPAVDVFGWGVVAYELATGRAPFGEPLDTDPVALAYRIVHEPLPPLVLVDDPALAVLITRTLAKDPSERPADGWALVARLQATRGTESMRPEAGAPDGPAHTPSRDSLEVPAGDRRVPWLLAAGLALLVIVVTAAVAFLATGTQDRTIDSGSGPATTAATALVPTTVPTTTSTVLPPTTTTVLVVAPIVSLVVALEDLGAGWALQGPLPAGTRPAAIEPSSEGPFFDCVAYPDWEGSGSGAFIQLVGGSAVRGVASFVLRGDLEADARAMYAGIIARYGSCASAHPEQLQAGQRGARLLRINKIATDALPGAQLARFEAVVQSAGGTQTDTIHVVLMQKGRTYVEVAFDSLQGPFPEATERHILEALAARMK